MKRILAMLLLAVMLLTAGCAGSGADKAVSAGEGFPRTVTDGAGREVTIEREPQRIVSGYYISTSLLIALGEKDKLVGMEAKGNTRPIYRLSAPELLELPTVGTAAEFDFETCSSLEPDLVILPLKLRDAVQTLEKLGMTVLLVNPENEDLLEETALFVGEATGSEEAADKLVSFLRDTEKMLEERLEGVSRPRVYISDSKSVLNTAGGEMYQSDMIALAGGENAASELPENYWTEVSYEQILLWDPEYMLLVPAAGYTEEEILRDPGLTGCSAVKEGNVFRIPGKAEAWDSPVPGGILGSVWLASVLHPDRISQEEYEETAEEFYETFYGFSFREAGE